MNTERQAQHTPTPWVVADCDGEPVIVDCGDGAIALSIAYMSGYPADEMSVNADFIVAACNAHDIMLSTLRIISMSTTLSAAALSALAAAVVAKVEA